ncbi:PTP99-like protein, partial [Mya arenaria]
GTEERTLHHMHFTCWPDKAIPDDFTAMIEFRQREQYQFLHTAVVYSLTFDCKQVRGENFNQYMKKHTTQQLHNTFKQLQHMVDKRSKDETEAVELGKQQLSKNRANVGIPGNGNRHSLYQNLKLEASDYMDAMFIHSFRVMKRYLVARTPLPETVVDFLKLVVQERCSCIVSFEAD